MGDRQEQIHAAIGCAFRPHGSAMIIVIDSDSDSDDDFVPATCGDAATRKRIRVWPSAPQATAQRRNKRALTVQAALQVQKNGAAATSLKARRPEVQEASDAHASHRFPREYVRLSGTQDVGDDTCAEACGSSVPLGDVPLVDSKADAHAAHAQQQQKLPQQQVQRQQPPEEQEQGQAHEASGQLQDEDGQQEQRQLQQQREKKQQQQGQDPQGQPQDEHGLQQQQQQHLECRPKKSHPAGALVEQAAPGQATGIARWLHALGLGHYSGIFEAAEVSPACWLVHG